MRHPVLGNLSPIPPDETAPWTICITNGPTQYLYTTDAEPGRLYDRPGFFVPTSR